MVFRKRPLTWFVTAPPPARRKLLHAETGLWHDS